MLYRPRASLVLVMRNKSLAAIKAAHVLPLRSRTIAQEATSDRGQPIFQAGAGTPDGSLGEQR